MFDISILVTLTIEWLKAKEVFFQASNLQDLNILTAQEMSAICNRPSFIVVLKLIVLHISIPELGLLLIELLQDSLVQGSSILLTGWLVVIESLMILDSMGGCLMVLDQGCDGLFALGQLLLLGHGCQISEKGATVRSDAVGARVEVEEPR